MRRHSLCAFRLATRLGFASMRLLSEVVPPLPPPPPPPPPLAAKAALNSMPSHPQSGQNALNALFQVSPINASQRGSLSGPALLNQLAASYEAPDAAMRCRMELFRAVRRAGGTSAPIAAVSGALSDESMDFLCDHNLSVRDFVELCGEDLIYLVPPPPESRTAHVAVFRHPTLVAFTRAALQHGGEKLGTIRVVPRAHLLVVATFAALLEAFTNECRRGHPMTSPKAVMNTAIAHVEEFEKYDVPHMRVGSRNGTLDRVSPCCMATHFNCDGVKPADLDGATAIDASLNLQSGFATASRDPAPSAIPARSVADFSSHVKMLRAASSAGSPSTSEVTMDVLESRELDLSANMSSCLVAAQLACADAFAFDDVASLARTTKHVLEVFPGYVLAPSKMAQLLKTSFARDLLLTVLPSRVMGNHDPAFRYGFLTCSRAAAGIAELVECGVERLATISAPGAKSVLREMRGDNYNYKRLPSVVRSLLAGGDFLRSDVPPSASESESVALAACISVNASPEATCLVVAAGCLPTTLLPVTRPVVVALAQRLDRCLAALEAGTFFVARPKQPALEAHAASLRRRLSKLLAEGPASVRPRDQLCQMLALFSCPSTASPPKALFLSLREAVELVTVPAYVPTAESVASTLEAALTEPLLDPLSMREEQLLRGEVQQSRSPEVLLQPGRIASNWTAVRQALMSSFTFAPPQSSWDAAAADPNRERHFLRVFPPFSGPLAAVFPATSTAAALPDSATADDGDAGNSDGSDVAKTEGATLPPPTGDHSARLLSDCSFAVADEAAAAYAPYQAESFDALRLARCVQADAHMSLRDLIAGGALFQLVNHDLQHVVLAHPELFQYAAGKDEEAVQVGGHVKFIVNPNYRPTQSRKTKAELQQGIDDFAAQIKSAPSSKRYRLVRKQKELQRLLLRAQFPADHPCYDPNVVLQMAFDSLPVDGPLPMEDMWARMPRCARLGPDLSTRVLQRAPHLFYCFEMGEDPPRSFVQRADLPHPVEPNPADIPLDDVLRMMIRICRFGEKDNRATNWSFLHSRLSKVHRARLAIAFGGDAARATPKQVALLVAQHGDLFRLDVPPGMSEADYIQAVGRNVSSIGIRTVKATPRARAFSNAS